MKYKKIPPSPQSVEEPLTVGAFQAKTELSRLLREAQQGKRFVITQRGKPVAELGPPKASASKRERWGDMEGKIWVADDFCEEIEDMLEYME